MRSVSRHSTFILASLFASVVCAQHGGSAAAHSRIGDRYYKNMAYAPAATEYELAAELGAVNEHVTKNLADCYMKLGNTEAAETWYAQVVKFLNREPMDLFYYAQALKGNAKYEEAEVWMDKYLDLAKPEGQPRKSTSATSPRSSRTAWTGSRCTPSVSIPRSVICAPLGTDRTG